MKFCIFLLWLKIVPIIYLISYSLFPLDGWFVTVGVTVYEYFCDDIGLRLRDDFGLASLVALRSV